MPYPGRHHVLEEVPECQCDHMGWVFPQVWGSMLYGRCHLHTSSGKLGGTVGEGNGNPLQCSCLENPGMGLHRVGHDWSDLAAALVKNLPASAGDASYLSLIPGLGRAPGGGHSDPLQYSCLENPVSREAWQTTVRSVAESWTQLSMHASKEIAVSLRKVHWGGWLRK